jgi:sn-glycerol 3-phosphate transport system permease protein
MAVGLSSSMMILKMMFNPSIGIINQLFGTDIQWFNDKHAAMALLVMAGVYLDIGLNFLLLHAALRNVPSELHEVAKIEGANGFQIFRYLQAPLIAPTFVFVLMTNIKDAMLISSPFLILTEGGPFRSTQTLVYQMYLKGSRAATTQWDRQSLGGISSYPLGLLLLLHMERRRVYYQ